MQTNTFNPHVDSDISDVLKGLESKILRTISFSVSNEHDVKDIAQEALIRIYRNIHTFDAKSCKLETWVYRIVKNLCIDFYRRQKPVDVLGDSDILLSSKQDVEKDFEQNEFSSYLADALKSLPSHYRKAFVLRHLEDRSLTEISDLLGLPVNTIKSHIHRAKQTLKGILTEYAIAC